MASDDKELEEQLLEAGNELADPPSSVEELLSLLDRVESCLSRVEQSPINSLQIALSPSLKALTGDKLLRHSDPDVKVAVASCISEITRITAPDAPYDDDHMKEVFQLIVSSFENLHDKSSRFYAKRTSILETVAKVRSCVVMLDLECDALILEMFQHFLKATREHYLEDVISSMETIMTLVLEESEDISLELLSPLLASIKKDNEEVFPTARKLVERVLENCATKIKPYLVQAVTTLGISVDDYSKVLASICQDTSDGECVTYEHVEDKGESAKQSLEESTQVVKEEAREAADSQQDNPDQNRSPKSVMSNGVACVREDNALADSKSIKKQEDADCSGHSKGLDICGHEELNDVNAKKVDNNEEKPEKATKRRGGKLSSSSKLAKLSECQVVANEKEAEKMPDSESHSKEALSSPHRDHSVETAGPSENDEEIHAKISSPKACNDESEVVASPSPSESLPDQNYSEKLGKTKTKDSPTKEEVTKDVSKKASEEASNSEAKPAKRPVKKALGRNADAKKSAVADSVKKGSGAASDTDAKKHSAKKLDENKGGGGSSSRKLEDKKKWGQGKAKSEAGVAKSSAVDVAASDTDAKKHSAKKLDENKGGGGSFSRKLEDKKKWGLGKAKWEAGVAKSSAVDVDKETVSSPRSGTKSTKDENLEETAKTIAKRKHTSGKENESDIKEYDEKLVGLRVEVWWPKDRQFYKGVIDSFDSVKKKHKVVYEDGEIEILNLVKEKWKVIKAGSDADGEEGSDPAGDDTSPDMPPRKKGKISAGESTKQEKLGASSSGGATGSNKSKGVPMKPGHKSKDGNKSKDSKTTNKSEDEVSRKAKDSTPKSGSSKSAAKKMTSKSKNIGTSKVTKSKDDDISTPRPSVKSEQETRESGKSKQKTPKTAASEGKPPKSGGKSNVNGSDKLKSGLLKRKDLESENSDVSAREGEDTKGKTSSSSKAQRSEAKSGKKRQKS